MFRSILVSALSIAVGAAHLQADVVLSLTNPTNGHEYHLLQDTNGISWSDAEQEGQIDIQGDLEYGGSSLTMIDVEGASDGEFDLVTLDGMMSLAGELVIDTSDLDATPEVTNGAYAPIEVDILVAAEWDGTRFDTHTHIDNGTGMRIEVIYPDDQRFIPTGPDDSEVSAALFYAGDINQDMYLDQQDLQLFARAMAGILDLDGDGIDDLNSSQLSRIADIGGSETEFACQSPGVSGRYGTGDGVVDFDDVRAFAFFFECNTDFTSEHVLATIAAVPEPDRGGLQFLAGLMLVICSIRRRLRSR